MSATMRAWKCASPGPINNTFKLLSDVPQPSADQLKAGEILVRVISVGLNPADYKVGEAGIIARTMLPYPGFVGQDLSGQVTAVGPGVDDVKVGDAVIGHVHPFKRPGALSEYAILDRDGYAVLPPGLDDLDQVAGAPVAAVTAYQTLAPYVKAGDRVLINGGSGGVGTFSIQIAKILGCHVTATCSAGKAALARELGADDIIDYKTTDVAAHLKAAGQEYAHVVDNAGHSLPSLYFASNHFLRRGGEYILVGAQPDFQSTKNILSAHLLPSFLGGGKHKISMYLMKRRHDDLQQLAQWMDEGKLRTVIDSTYEFEDALEAFAHLKTGSCNGKVIVHVSPRS